MGRTELLIIAINAVAWLALILGIYVAIFRRLGRRGRIIMQFGTALAAVLVVALIVTSVTLANTINAAPPMRPSPSDAILTATWTDSYNHPLIFGVNARAGSIRWQSSLAVSYYHEETTANGVLYIAEDATITAIRLSDGARLWQQAAPGGDSVAPLVTRGDALISMSIDNSGFRANALALNTHALKWSTPLNHFSGENQFAVDQHPAFAASADMLFVGSDDGTVSALRLSDGTLAWTHALMSPADAAQVWVVVGADLVYAYDNAGHIFALRQTDGALVWREPAGLKPQDKQTFTATASSLYACGSVASATGATESALASLDPATGAIRWERAAECGFTSLIESEGVVYQAGQTLTAMRASDGAALWSATTQTPDLGFTSVQADHGVVFAATSITSPHQLTFCARWWSSGTLFCHSSTYLAAFNGATGARYWQTTVGDYPSLISEPSPQ